MDNHIAVHGRISINALSSVRWTFEQDLALCRELGVKWAGLFGPKLGEDVEGAFASLARADIKVSTVIVPRFDLGRPDSWDGTRRVLRRWVDVMAEFEGWSMYLTPGRSAGASWEESLELLTDAVKPSVEYARDHGVKLAFEPSRRTEVSFVNTLRDAVDVAAQTGLGIVADIGNFWMERDLGATLRKAAPYVDLVQLTDVSIGSIGSPDDPPSGGRTPFGEGDLPIGQIMQDIKSMGYEGPFDLELIGPLGDAEGYEPTIRRGVASADAALRDVGL